MIVKNITLALILVMETKNYIYISICIIALLFNTYLWLMYRKNSDEEKREKEGWNSYYFVATLLLAIVLLNLLNK